jgi:hypothetical protein
MKQYYNKNFWEELIVYFPFTIILISDTTSRKNTLVCMRKTIWFGRLQCWYYWWEWFMKYAVEMVSGGMIWVPSFMKIGSSIQVILRLLPRHSERLQSWYYNWEGFMVYAIETTSYCMICIPSFMTIRSGIQVILTVPPQQFERL